MIDITNLTNISSDYLNTYAKKNSLVENDETFSSVFNSMMKGLEETNDLQNAAEVAEIQFALGESDNTHDLLIAESKASVALQYTIAVRDKLIDAYKEIMQMSI